MRIACHVGRVIRSEVGSQKILTEVAIRSFYSFLSRGKRDSPKRSAKHERDGIASDGLAVKPILASPSVCHKRRATCSPYANPARG